MRLLICIAVLAVVVLVECSHTFLGTNVGRPAIYHITEKHGARAFRKRVEELKYSIPSVSANRGRVIQGIMAYDLTNSGASANVTQGGLGANFVTLRMKSDRGKSLNYDVYIYA